MALSKLHSYVDLSDPTYLRYGYEQTYAATLNAIFPRQETVAALFIGGGGYTFPHYIEVTRPGSTIDVIEIDPGVTEIAYSELGLTDQSVIRSMNEDARSLISRMPAAQQYDLIVGDAFNDFSVPYHLTTLEFNQLVAAHLTERGFYLVNIIDGLQGDFFRAYVHTLQQTFAQVYVSDIKTEIGTQSWQTYVVVASQQQLAGLLPSGQFLPQATLDAYLQAGPTLTLSDDYVPVDNLLAPVFADSGL